MATAAQAPPLCLAGGLLDRAGIAQCGEGRFVSDPAGVVTCGEEEDCGAVCPDADQVQHRGPADTDDPGGAPGEFIDLVGQVLDSAGEQAHREDGLSLGHRRRGPQCGDKRRITQAGEQFAQIRVDGQQYSPELVQRLGAGLDG